MPPCIVEMSDEFEAWFKSLKEAERIEVLADLKVLGAEGVALGYPLSSKILQSRHRAMRELRSQVFGRPFRELYHFDPRRVAYVCIGGEKTGDEKQWYRTNVPIADKVYSRHLAQLATKGLIRFEKRKEKGHG